MTVERPATAVRHGDDAKTTVVIADADPLVAGGLALLIGNCPTFELIGSYLSCTEAVFQAQCRPPDVVVMDIPLSDPDAFTAVRLLAPDGSRRASRVVLVSAVEDAQAVVRALQAGVSGFVLKRSAPADLVRAILHVAAGRAWLDPYVTAQVVDAVARMPQAWRERGASSFERLTPRELEVLVLMAGGLSNAEISDRLVVSEGTVKTHVSRVLMKLAARDRAQAIALAYRSGWVSMAS